MKILIYSIIPIIGILSIIGFPVKDCPHKLLNTKWIYDEDGCQDFYEFKEQNKYMFYSCETDEKKYGIFSIHGDTVIVEQHKGEFDSEFPEDSRHRGQKVKIKLLIESNKKMKPVEMWEFKSGDWVKSKFKFGENYVFIKK